MQNAAHPSTTDDTHGSALSGAQLKSAFRDNRFSRWLLAALPWLLIAFFSIAYIRLALLNHLQFRTGLDLGIYGQAMYHVSHFRLPYSTFKEQVLWGDHAHFILVLLAPLYRLFPDVRTLLVVQALAVTLSGWALYRVALDVMTNILMNAGKERAGDATGGWPSRGRSPGAPSMNSSHDRGMASTAGMEGSVAAGPATAHLFALAVLLATLAFVGIQYALDFDFHPSVLTGAALLWAIYAFHFKKPVLYWLAVVLGLITREDAGPIFFMLGAYLMFRRTTRRLGAVTMLISAVYFFTVGYIIMPIWTPGGIPLVYLDVVNKNPLKILVDIVRNPITTIQNMIDAPEKRETIRVLFSSFGFLPLLTPFTYLASAPIFISRFLSPNEYRWFLQSHSNANILPVLAYGSVLGAAVILRFAKRGGPTLTRGVTWGLALLLLVSTYWTGWRDPDVPLRKLTRPEFTDPAFLPKTGIAAFALVKAIIPSEGGVSASSGLVPHLAGRKYIVNFPEVKKHTHWIVLSPEFNTWPLRKGETDKAIAELLKDPNWELLWQDYAIYLFKKKRFSVPPEQGQTADEAAQGEAPQETPSPPSARRQGETPPAGTGR